MINRDKGRQYLKDFNFRKLFLEELGWDKHEQNENIEADGSVYSLSAFSHKRGMVIFTCSPGPNGKIPQYNTRKKIETKIAKSAFEHIIIFIDSKQENQLWQWAKKETGKPVRVFHVQYNKNQSGENLLQKLDNLQVSLDEEELLLLPVVTGRAEKAFFKEKVTKKFYEGFQKEHSKFKEFIKGIEERVDHEWYTSLMLNRLMFIYFIQKKGFLDGETDYLKIRLKEVQKISGADKFHTFYRVFLLVLFHEGLGKPEDERDKEIRKLIGEVPYLNGGLFDVHQIEKLYQNIEIPDKAFDNIFSFFDQYQWHLDERPLKNDREINPDVIGYIFEKYINQKQMGAYYTKEDITEYISKNTIIPFIFDEAKKECAIAFKKESAMWQMLKNNPDRYFYDAVKHGTDLRLPEDIAAGVDTAKPELLERRKGWNKTAHPEFGLPTEIWREVIERRKRYEEVKQKILNDEVTEINDFITYNLNIRQFAQDVVENCEGPELLRAIYYTIAGRKPAKSNEIGKTGISILDPTCGSGAFLFAALNILEPLYEACLERMSIFAAEQPLRFDDFRKIIAECEKHPSEKYYIYKTIILNNLYGVDIMNEAVEIAKLRLFLKLVSQVEKYDQIEPLPDIDFNIRTGNTLVGFATLEKVKNAVQSTFDFGNTIEKINEKAETASMAYETFKNMQGEMDVKRKDIQKTKSDFRKRLEELNEELNQYLAKEYGVKPDKQSLYEKWKNSHQPFHWFVEFYNIVHNKKGFDVIIGNPPFVEYKEVDYAVNNLITKASGAIHAMCAERSFQLVSKIGCISMVFPMSLVSTQRMGVVQQILELNRNLWYSNYAWRPAKLFETVNRAISIFISTPSQSPSVYTTNYQKWTSVTRNFLIPRIAYNKVSQNRESFWVPKLTSIIENSILQKVINKKITIGRFIGPGQNRVYYRTTGGLYWKIFTDFSPAFKVNGKSGHSSRETWLTLTNKNYVKPLAAILSSNLFWWWYTITSNLRDLNPIDIHSFPISESVLEDKLVSVLGKQYLEDINNRSSMLARVQKQTGKTETQSFKIQNSKPIIDEIDKVLAQHYGFTDEELDFIINYDIKYRMGKEEEEE